MIFSRLIPIQALCLIALPSFGCSTGPDVDEGDYIPLQSASDVVDEVGNLEVEPGTLLATATLPDDVVVRFYELEGGGILIQEIGSIDHMRPRSIHEEQSDALQRYELLTGRPAPLRLREAADRAAGPGVERNRSPRPISLEVVPASAAESGSRNSLYQLSNGLTHEQFVQRWCGTGGAKRSNWIWVTGAGNTGSWNDMNFVQSAVLAVTGDVRHVVRRQPWYTWKDVVRVMVPQGVYHRAEWLDNIDFDVNIYVDNADNDIYDACHYAN